MQLHELAQSMRQKDMKFVNASAKYIQLYHLKVQMKIECYNIVN